MRRLSLEESLAHSKKTVEFFSPCFYRNGILTGLVEEELRRNASQSSSTQHSVGSVGFKCYSSFGVPSHLFKDEIDPKKVAEEAFLLSKLCDMGCEIMWRPNLENEFILIDGEAAYIFEKDQMEFQEVSVDKKIRNLSLKCGFFNEIVGKVALVQELTAKPYDVDLFVRLEQRHGLADNIPTSQNSTKIDDQFEKETMPIFLHSQSLEESLYCGDILRIFAVTNVAGEGVMGSSIPAEIFVEGLGVQYVSKARSNGSPSHPANLRVHDEVEKLLFTKKFKVPIKDIGKSTKKRTEWTFWAYKEIVASLKRRGLHVQVTDESSIITTLNEFVEDSICIS